MNSTDWSRRFAILSSALVALAAPVWSAPAQPSFDEFTDRLAAEFVRVDLVDTGLHSGHWSRQRAIDYGIPAAEVERYVVMPGQACAYKMGEREILAQREKAHKALGARFSMKQFHDLLLRTGTVPLAVLGQVVDADIAATLKQ